MEVLQSLGSWPRAAESVLDVLYEVPTSHCLGCLLSSLAPTEMFLFLFQGTTRPSSLGAKGKVLKAKVTARTDSGLGKSGSGIVGGGSTTLAPPMSTVMVERHQPVTKVSMLCIFFLKSIMGHISNILSRG